MYLYLFIYYPEKTLWSETAKDKYPATVSQTAHVLNQEQCQEHCLADVSCKGILYSYKQNNTPFCYTCSYPVLPLASSKNDFGFYKSPGITILYKQ